MTSKAEKEALKAEREALAKRREQLRDAARIAAAKSKLQKDHVAAQHKAAAVAAEIEQTSAAVENAAKVEAAVREAIRSGTYVSSSSSKDESPYSTKLGKKALNKLLTISVAELFAKYAIDPGKDYLSRDDPLARFAAFKEQEIKEYIQHAREWLMLHRWITNPSNPEKCPLVLMQSAARMMLFLDAMESKKSLILYEEDMAIHPAGVLGKPLGIHWKADAARLCNDAAFSPLGRAETKDGRVAWFLNVDAFYKSAARIEATQGPGEMFRCSGRVSSSSISSSSSSSSSSALKLCGRLYTTETILAGNRQAKCECGADLKIVPASTTDPALSQLVAPVFQDVLHLAQLWTVHEVNEKTFAKHRRELYEQEMKEKQRAVNEKHQADKNKAQAARAEAANKLAAAKTEPSFLKRKRSDDDDDNADLI
jgi:hypothetical protein